MTTGFNLNPVEACTFVNLVSNLKNDQLCWAKTTKHDLVIPGGQTKNVSCIELTYTGQLNQTTSVLFEADETSPWPCGLKVFDSHL